MYIYMQVYVSVCVCVHVFVCICEPLQETSCVSKPISTTPYI